MVDGRHLKNRKSAISPQWFDRSAPNRTAFKISSLGKGEERARESRGVKGGGEWESLRPRQTEIPGYVTAHASAKIPQHFRRIVIIRPLNELLLASGLR